MLHNIFSFFGYFLNEKLEQSERVDSNYSNFLMTIPALRRFSFYRILSVARTSFSSSRMPLRARNIRIAFTIGRTSVVLLMVPSVTAMPTYQAKTSNSPHRHRRA